MTKLSVNLNKVALLRNQRDVGYPNVVEHAQLILEAGGQGLTMHPRPDERHIRRSDVGAIEEFLSQWPDKEIELNIEGYPSDDFLALVTKHHCHQVTLVPDDPNQRTSDHGWDISKHKELLTDAIAQLHKAKRRVSLFADPDPAIAEQAKEVGTDRIELYTGPYAEKEIGVAQYVATAQNALALDIEINAGHDLSLDNLTTFIKAIPECAEVSIGHAITADALKLGWTQTIALYLEAIKKGHAT